MPNEEGVSSVLKWNAAPYQDSWNLPNQQHA